MTDTKPKCRWRPRISLRSSLIVVTIFCVWGGWFIQRVERQKNAVEWVEENGGYVLYGYQRDDAGSDIPAAKQKKSWVRSMIGDDYFESVVYAQIRPKSATDLTPLTCLSYLKKLEVLGFDIASRGRSGADVSRFIGIQPK